MLQHVLVPIHRDGWRFIAIFAVVTFVLFLIWAPLGWIGVIATLWCIYFFRDPPRVTPLGPDLVISPADGLVVSVGPAMPPAELALGDAPMTRIGIFLNVFDVHINRSPMDAAVERTAYHRGQFLNASFDKASELNERMAIRLKARLGAGATADIAVVQIAGLVARRIVCNLSAGQDLVAGERFGLIRFGSRTDLYLPPEWAIHAVVGQRAVGGETVLAEAASAGSGATGAYRRGAVR